MHSLKLFSLFWFLIRPFSAFAFLTLESPNPLKYPLRYTFNYTEPNELYPEVMLPALANIDSGVHVFVGTHRGFLLGGASSNTTHLLALDRDPFVVMHNQLIIAMLTLAKSPREFYQFRVDLDDFAQTLESEGLEQGLDVALHLAFLEKLRAEEILTPPNLETMRYRVKFWMWRRDFNRSSVRFWECPVKSARLKAMAMEGRIQAHLLDFTNEGRVKDLSRALEISGLKISSLDFSNAHEEKYMGLTRIQKTIKSLEGNFSQKARVILTWVQDFEYLFLPPEFLESLHSLDEGEVGLSKYSPLPLDEVTHVKNFLNKLIFQ